MTAGILVGDCRHVLSRLPAGSVHACGTSPPYWGLRDYQIQPSVWGGDENCQHDFAEETVTGDFRIGLGMEELSKAYRGGGKKAGKVDSISAVRGTCLRCGAWRGAFGLEPTPELFIAHAVEVFREVHRVLRDDGTLWVNIGDSYATGAGAVGDRPGGGYQGDRWAGLPAGKGHRGRQLEKDAGKQSKRVAAMGPMTQPNRMPLAGLKPKDLVGIPWMLAFALRADGWWLRQEIIWHKPNPMPESVEDRCTKAHEQLFLLAKSERYYFDADAIAEPSGTGFLRERERPNGLRSDEEKQGDYGFTSCGISETRNKRSVWTISTKPFAEAHFATFPPELIEPCIRASTSERGCCPACGAGWVRVTSKTRSNESGSGRSGRPPVGKSLPPNPLQAGTEDDVRNGPVITTTTLGWYPRCRCDGLPALPPHPKRPTREQDEPAEHAFAWHRRRWLLACRKVDDRRKALCDSALPTRTVAAVFLDPFGGAGTTALVAERLQRDSVIIEISPDYAAMAERRVDGDAPLFRAVAAE